MNGGPVKFRVLRDRDASVRAAEQARIMKARDEAARCVALGHDEADAIRARAREEGLATVTLELMRGVAIRERARMELESRVGALALEVARTILGREANTATEIVRDLVRQSLERVARARRVLLRVHPDEVPTISEKLQQLIPSAMVGAALSVEPDDTVARGGVVVETEIGRVDARLETQIAAIARAWEIER